MFCLFIILKNSNIIELWQITTLLCWYIYNIIIMYGVVYKLREKNRLIGKWEKGVISLKPENLKSLSNYFEIRNKRSMRI